MEVSALKSFSAKAPGPKVPKGITLNFSEPENTREEKIQGSLFDILVFTDAAWDFINQRPRHLVLQLAKYNNILFIETPYVDNQVEKDHYRIIKRVDNLTVIKPVIKNFNNLKDIIKQLINTDNISIGLFCSSIYFPLTSHFKFGKIIYDIENEMTKPSDIMRNNEKKLIKRSDIIITGSKSAFEEKSMEHENVHWVPSPVDDVLFKQRKKIPPPPECLINPERPIIGYCGVIDHRIDFDFIEDAAIKMPFSTFVLIGPVINPGRERLPDQGNICYLNLSKYSAIPSYLRAIDIGMIPLVVDERSRFISSSLILKYMTANKPIISTPVYDIVRDYGHCIDIVSTADDFCVSAARKLIPNKVENEERWICYNKILNRNSWEDTALKIQKLIEVQK